jgi:SpoVK/Ycf46/Vps4 family AAA+-type ATPase
MKEIFTRARTHPPSIGMITIAALTHSNTSAVFFDEIDSLALDRSSPGSDSCSRRVLTEFLLQMNSLSAQERVFIVAATNQMNQLDPACVRRFERRIEIALPKKYERAEMFRLYSRDTHHDLTEINFEQLADMTEGFSGADIHRLIQQVLMLPVHEIIGEQSDFSSNSKVPRKRPVHFEDFQRQLTSLTAANS